MTTLRRLREVAGLNREDFAHMAGVRAGTLEKHEQGKHRMSLEDAVAYAKALSQRVPKTPSKLLAELAELDSA